MKVILRKPMKGVNITALGLCMCLNACAPHVDTIDKKPQLETTHMLSLENAHLSAQFTKSFGGRLTGFSVPGYESVVKFDTDLAQENPTPEVSIKSGEPHYLGHSVWLSPQSQWWNQQDVIPKQRGQEWPPDPNLTLRATDPVLTDTELKLVGHESPISGVKIVQTFELLPQGCLKVKAQAQNIRNTPVEWGLWFNTRIHPDATVFAPVQGVEHVRSSKQFTSNYVAPQLVFENGIASLKPEIEGANMKGRRGKLILDPSAGWMAAHVKGQVFVVGFEYLAKEAIHPDQGQVEFYFDQNRADETAGFIEMETHAAFTVLKAGESMDAVQYWSVAPYVETQNLSNQIEAQFENIQHCKRNSL